MFDRFIRLAKAKKALREQRFEDALQLAADPLIQADRGAGDVRSAAREQLLARAKKKLEGGDLAGARAELRQMEKAGRCEVAASLGREIESAEATDHGAVALARRAIDDARRHLARGDAVLASAQLATIATAHLLLERQQVAQLVAEHRRLAQEHLSEVVRLLDRGDAEAAVGRFARAVALDRDTAAAHDIRLPMHEAVAKQRVAAIGKRIECGDLAAAFAMHRSAVGELPGIAATRPWQQVGASLEKAQLDALRACTTIDEAFLLARSARDAAIEWSEPLARLLDCLARASAATRGGDRTIDGELVEAARQAGAKALAAAVAARSALGQAHDEVLAQARAALAGGELEQARTMLTQLLAEQPMHESARRELDVVDQGLADLAQRLAAARAAARSGRLREACTVALGLVGPGRIGVEAQAVATEVRARMAVVDRGLDEVRVALYGRAASSVEGVRHCLLRLEELSKVQVDHEDLAKVAAAVQAEIEALETCEQVATELERTAVADALGKLTGLVDCRARLLAEDRLDARLCALGDRVTQIGDAALAAGRLTELQACADVLTRFAGVRAEFGTRAERWATAAEVRRKAADELVDQAQRQLAARDLAEAERIVEQAEVQWAESAAVRAMAEQLRALRAQTETLEKVEVLAQQRDFHGANQKLAALPPTPALLRTRIYDMKQNLARAQGLEGAFLLRIDEGGEHLVLRGESVSIGNVRQTRADVPILANVAGLHASIRRSMSFHGGMQDTVVAEEGEVRVDGSPVTSHRLVAGDRVLLGSALSFVYQQPCSRSLTTGLQLQGGFQVAGTDRLMLMKDRGRDGRILIGSGRDVHVRLPRATGEIELFTTNTGQMRVLCEGGGTIDRVAFRGEHPVAAGQVIEAAGVGFVLLPWRPTV